jgi:diguanylate cyclase (GGDEF)-like protein/PAS domain S-box-containing protein
MPAVFEGDANDRGAPVGTPRVALITGLGTILVAIFVLLGWTIGVEALESVLVGSATMKPQTAVCLALLGAALTLHQVAPRTSRAAAGAAGAIATVVLLAYITGSELSPDRILFADAVGAGGGLHPGRMAPVTATCIILLSSSNLLRSVGRRGLAFALALTAMAPATLAMTSYVLGLDALRAVDAFSSIALNTAVCLVALGIGTLWSMPERGLVPVARSGPGARMIVARALPIILVAPVLLAALCVSGERQGWYVALFGIAIMTVGASSIGIVVLWWTGRAVARFERSSAASLAELSSSNTRLEHEVAERTAALTTTEGRLRAGLDALDEGVVFSDAAGRIQRLNKAARSLLGYTVDELDIALTAGRFSVRDEHDLDGPGQPMTTLEQQDDAYFARVTTKVGTELHLRITVRPVIDDDGHPSGTVAAFRDITSAIEADRSRRLAERRMEWLAFHDALTELPNRAFLLERLEQTLARPAGDTGPVALLFLDLDGFKLVNDQRGHEAGDRLLVCVADRLRLAVDPRHTLARLGGDEFVLLMEHVADPAEAHVVGECMLAALRAPFGEDTISASIGIAFDADHDASSLLRDADVALYTAKALGRDRVVLHTPRLVTSREHEPSASHSSRDHDRRRPPDAGLAAALAAGAVAAGAGPDVDAR